MTSQMFPNIAEIGGGKILGYLVSVLYILPRTFSIVQHCCTDNPRKTEVRETETRTSVNKVTLTDQRH